MSSGKIRKGSIVHHIKSSKPMERWQVDLVQLASTVSTKDFKYLFTMVDHFSKFGWARWIIDKKINNRSKGIKKLNDYT